MEPDPAAAIRRFNRTVTQRIGALNDEYLSRDRPLGVSRVLWEIEGGIDVREIRERLDLDPGYLSRLLRQLEGENLVRVRPAPYDHRVRFAELTKAGLAERAILDKSSDELAWSILEPLNDEQRGRLITAMAEVERLFNVGAIEIRVEDPTSKAAYFCMHSYYDELKLRFEAGFEVEESLAPGPDDLVEPAGLLLLAFLHKEPVGCGALRFYSNAKVDVKRMWVSPDARGLGIGRRILSELELESQQRGYRSVRLETNRALKEAISLYKSSGYREVEAFNNEPYGHHWFEKALTSTTGSVRTSGIKSHKKRGKKS
jgi:DNA-binding MarR family transcriptional regulator/predicted GNAT family N-acyltransferase